LRSARQVENFRGLRQRVKNGLFCPFFFAVVFSFLFVKFDVLALIVGAGRLPLGVRSGANQTNAREHFRGP